MKKYCWFIFLSALFCNPATLAEPILVTDFAGRQVRLEQPATRIVALAPHIVENVFSAGGGDLLVGTVSYANYPEAANQIPRVGSIYGFSLEAIIALNPDLVMVWPSAASEQMLQKFTELGLPIYMDEPRLLEDVAKSIRDIGLLTGRVDRSKESSEAYLQQLAQLRQRYTDRQAVDVLYQVWNDPLQTINGQHIISDVIRLCGGRNIFADAIVIAPKISMESVIDRNPAAIIASGMGQERPEWLDEWRQWPSLQAVKQQHLFFIHPDLLQRHTVRILQGAEQMCGQLDQVRSP